MKYLLIIMAFSLVLMAGDEVFTQVVSADKESSFRDGFSKKVRYTGLPYEEETLSTNTKLKMQRDMAMAQSRTLKKMNASVSEPQPKVLQTVAPIHLNKIEKIEETVIKRKETKYIMQMKEDVKTEEIYCKGTKQALRQSEIARAISFYKNSSYYIFK